MGKMSKYYIGYELDDKLTALSVMDKDFQLIDTDLTSVINFSNTFATRDDLVDFLAYGPVTNVIPDGAKLCYVCESTYKGNTHLSKVLGLDYICLGSTRNFSIVDEQIEYIKANKYDVDFITDLYMTVLKNYSFTGSIERYIGKKYTSEDFVRTFKNHRADITGSNNPVVSIMDLIYNSCLYANRIGTDAYEYDRDNYNISDLIDRLYSDLTIKKDKNGNKKHDRNTGKYLRYDKALGYLTILISNDLESKYLEYQNAMMEEEVEIPKCVNVETEDLVSTRNFDDETEEFLESSDFERINQDPEENGYKLRKSMQ